MSKEDIVRGKIVKLEQDIKSLEAQEEAIVAQLIDKDYTKTAKDHIKLLHEYNEIRDLAHMLLSKIAMEENTTQAAVMERFGVTADD
ncbi:Mating-type switching protein swi5 [Taphrina deformans PYCC 5710]|uniref:Mating-type switching protein swi5 n=1 Tax=Taphrina deformans (strain PYCC 5710 / ATCC 11124 / CBS 356.35 / IMI 108563 / JCM 9778 / NBRC 8474) TaxID=1097556 RepID=R4X895_TAPDE|nr:Mating-type switching protein swi5 [Taphrina deformans PYCC 5710]|eukprot:CCG81748.1 Mating-type switching protein swi5 [Taphrina deformans PYCC 5710]